MKFEEIEKGMKVNIPTTKSIGVSFKEFLDEKKSLANRSIFGIVHYITYNTKNIEVKFKKDPDVGGEYIYLAFKAEDLTPYEEINESASISSIPEQSLEAPIDFNNPPLEEQPKHKDWEMGDSSLLEGEKSFPTTVVSAKEDSKLSQMLDKKIKISEERAKDDSLLLKNQGLRYNDGKRDYTLMDVSAFDSMIDVLAYGAHKYSTFRDLEGVIVKGSEIYKDIADKMIKSGQLTLVSSGRDNWKLGGPNMTLLKLLSSLMRHLVAFMSGQDNDEESKLPHIGHMMCNLMFIGYHWNQHKKNKKAKKGTQFDDRFKS